jgi:hypothetical protein
MWNGPTYELCFLQILVQAFCDRERGRFIDVLGVACVCDLNIGKWAKGVRWLSPAHPIHPQQLSSHGFSLS